MSKNKKINFSFSKKCSEFLFFFKFKPTRNIKKKTKSSITKACTEFRALDGHAFDVMKGDGFKTLVKALFDAGRCTNNLSIEAVNLRPHPTTVGIINTINYLILQFELKYF